MNEQQQKTLIRAEFKSLLRDDYDQCFDDIPLFELGIDSLDFFEKILYLEEDLGFKFKVEDITNQVTLNDLFKMIVTEK